MDGYTLPPNGKAEFWNIVIAPKTLLKLGFYDAGIDYGNGFYVRVGINGSVIWSSRLSAPSDYNVLQSASVSLDRYAGQTVKISIETDQNGIGTWWGDDPIIVGPIVTNKIITTKNSCVIDPDRDADIVIGQPDLTSGACNRDNMKGVYNAATNKTLCLMPYPLASNIAENWMRINFDVDALGNLYVPDPYNNRVLVYNQPFAKGLKADIPADYVLGQPSFTSNGINHGLGPRARDNSSLYLGVDPSVGQMGITAKGVSVDPKGDAWVADPYNGRVLRFPKKATGVGYESQANLVIGQKDFVSSDRSNCGKSLSQLNWYTLCAPLLARIDPVSGDLFVLDQINAPTNQYFYTVIVWYQQRLGNFTNGQKAMTVFTVRQPSPFDSWWGWKPIEYIPQFTSFQFSALGPLGPKGEYAKGRLWLIEHEAKRLLLVAPYGYPPNTYGAINAVINAPATPVPAPYDSISKYRRGGEGFLCPPPFGAAKYESFCPSWPGGSFGFDNAWNIYLTDEWAHRIVRYATPFKTTTTNGITQLPYPNGGLFSDGYPNSISAQNVGESGGAITYFGIIPINGQNVYTGQLIVKDLHRYLVWNNYLNRSMGAKADYVVGQNSEFEKIPNTLGRHAFHAIDDAGRMWTYGATGKIMIFQLPFTGNNQPIARDLSLYWKNSPYTLVDYKAETGIAFDKRNKAIFVNDRKNHRV
ncbi:MAG: hypothetical protein HYT88_00260, partial [Candidatus Omnitrophica bacterium]|nr:hypothetical protein [Candidatus Omnitrophota bacterium]